MKFIEHLSAHITPEWRSRYMDYDKLKEMIKNCLENAPASGSGSKNCERDFFNYCKAELSKVDSFFNEKLSEIKRRYTELQRELTTGKKASGTISKKDLKTLQFEFSEFYLSLILLQNFQKLNYTGFRNLLRLYDKTLKRESGKKWLQRYVHETSFFIKNDLHVIIVEVENLYINEFAGGDRKTGMERLRIPPFKEIYNTWTTFRIGLYVGAFILLIVYEIFFWHIERNWYNVIPLYRGSFAIIFELFLWSVNMQIYRKYGINQILIFEIDPRNHIAINDLMEVAAIFAFLWSLTLLAYLYHSQLPFPIYLPPVFLYFLYVILLFNPTKTIYYSSRMWTLNRLKRLCLAPTYFVQFPDFWIGDLMTSMRTLFLDIKYVICFVRHNPTLVHVGYHENTCHNDHAYVEMVIEMLPPWFRFAQVIRRYRDTGFAYPHLVNAGKFFLLIITIAAIYTYNKTQVLYVDSPNPWYFLMLIITVINSISNSIWDFYFDWGLLRIWKGKKLLLREQLVYPKPLYYIGLISNIVLRLDVVAKICVHNKYLNAVLVKTVMFYGELFRRFIWNIFRLENEHFNNCGQFRVHRDISVRPRVAGLFTDDEEFIRQDLIDELIVNVIKEEVIPITINERKSYARRNSDRASAILPGDKLVLFADDTKSSPTASNVAFSNTTRKSLRKSLFADDSKLSRNSSHVSFSNAPKKPVRKTLFADDTKLSPSASNISFTNNPRKSLRKSVKYSRKSMSSNNKRKSQFLEPDDVQYHTYNAAAQTKRAEDLLILEYDSDDDVELD